MSLSAEQLADLVGFLTPETRKDVRMSALQIIEGLSVSDSNLHLFKQHNDELIHKLVELHLADSSIRSATSRILVNLSASDPLLSDLLLSEPYFLSSLIGNNAWKSESAAKLLSNLTRSAECAERVYKELPESFLEQAIDVLLQVQTSSIGDFVGFVLRNLSQLAACRRRLIVPNPSQLNPASLLSKLYPLVSVDRVERRSVAVDIIRNCCFDADLHQSLIVEDQDDLLVCLIRPLAGPEELTAEENEDLPVDLQYLEPTKIREPEVEIRVKLLESLYQLCSTAHSREIIRQKSIYYLLREYHNWEKDEMAERLNGNVIGLLTRTEDEIGADNLTAIDDEKLARMGSGFVQIPQ